MFANVLRYGAPAGAASRITKYMLALLAALAAASVMPALAQQVDPKVAEANAAWDEAAKAGTRGPADIKLRDQATLKIPTGHFFVPATEGLRVMRAYGNSPNANTFTGLVVSMKNDDMWMIVINFVKEGYIKDDDAKDWNANELLSNLREGTEEANKQRAERGFPQIEVTGWVEKPTYDAATHRLVWSMGTREKGASPQATPGVNYNTYALGRDGYFSLNLVTNLAHVDAQKPISHSTLANLSYVEGKRYQDFNASTDRVAEYGLAALIGVAAAKKLGFFAIAAAFIAKFAKVIFVVALGVGASFMKFFGRKKSDTPPPAA